jgi:protein-S-isoprenylcysteine O-methyltransferase Ste14
MLLLLKNILFTIVVPGTVAVCVPLLVTRDRSPASGLLFACALLVLSLGAMIYAWCVWDFARFGRGTPAPMDAPKRLVSRGLYRYTRNPMYVGVLTFILGWALMFRAPVLIVYALVIGVWFHLFILFYEEPHLRREFGSGYDEYCARVRRWLPRL